MHTTTRLGLDVLDGPDAVTVYPVAQAQAMGILDAAGIVLSGPIASIPAAGTIGRWYHATDLNQRFFDNGTIWQNEGPRFVSGLPGSPYPGQVIAVQVADAIVSGHLWWQFVYDTGDPSSHKWVFLGGPSLIAEVATNQTVSSTTYADPATSGPAVTVPFAGDYEIEIGCLIGYTVISGSDSAFMSYAVGAGTASDTTAARITSANGDTKIERISARSRLTGVSASTALTAKYRTGGGNANAPAFQSRYIKATPVRVG